MSWLRVGDTSSVDPLVLALEDPADDLWRAACFGVFIGLSALSAQHDTDYVVGTDWLRILAGARGDDVMKALVAGGLASVVGGRGARRTWRLVDDRPDLIHIRPKAERDWELTRKRDTKNPRLLAPVLLRDGDACRYCARPVNAADHKSGRQRTLDHLRPGEPAETADDLVVACLECNGRRGRDWQDEPRRATFHERWQLLPVPAPLLFQRTTVTWLAERGVRVPEDAVVLEPRSAARAARAATTAASRATALAARGTTPTTSPRATPAPTDPGSEVPSLASRAGATAPTGRKTPTEEPSTASQAGATAPRGSTTSAKEPHSATRAGAAASQASTTSTTASPSTTRSTGRRTQRPATPSPTAPEDPARTTHPSAHPARTDGCGGDGSGRVGSGRVPGPPPGPDASTQHPEQAAAPPPRRRGRRRPRSPGEF